MCSIPIDNKSQLFGLPVSLLVPIAAKDSTAIQRYVGNIQERVLGRSGRVNAMLVAPFASRHTHDPTVPLWSHPNSGHFKRRLHQTKEVWVHVDYNGYRKAYERFGMPEIPQGYVLDHIQNREAIRLRDYSHPYLRLCPVSREVNSSAGHKTGGEGMEKEHLKSLEQQPESNQSTVLRLSQSDVIYADPMDLTKMLNVPTGTFVLEGVRNMLPLFYP